ncbi:MAG: copper transporter [Candidatus Fervidibacter sp.]|uniref:copper transporter n=1 Tax=Candidatus Fervidibacter sp. TaxID=3100871 RepID=UPI00404930C6
MTGETKMVDIRLYIGTLVAVLVFFGLGVLVGIGITREPRAEQLYQRIERQLQRYREETARELQKRDKQIEQLEGEIASLRSRSKANEQFIEKVAPMLVRNLLLFRNIGFVFTTPDANGELSAKAQAFLEKAGAKVPLKITLHPEEIQTADTVTWRKVAGGLGLILDNADDEAIKSGVWKRIALIIRYGDPQNVWQVLNKFGWVKVSGNTQIPVGSVVLICSGQSQRDLEQVKSVDLALVQALRSVGVRTIVSAPSPADDKLLSLYQMGEAPIVDHIDTPLGLLSLVAALIGRQDNYGFSETANRPFPEPEWFVQQGQ